MGLLTEFRQTKKSRIRQHISNLKGMVAGSHFVYALWCPMSKRIRYIGYTCGFPWSRLSNHLAGARAGVDSPKNEWLTSLLSAGLLPTMRLLRAFSDEVSARECEVELIRLLGCKRDLVNRPSQRHAIV